ncbi:hypothetical protein ACS0TY_014656 [Phlomoides rotata]
MEMTVFGGVVGKLSRQIYAVFCLGVVLIAVVIAQRYFPSESEPVDDEATGGAASRT